jgi:phosphatidylserine decarboxylase
MHDFIIAGILLALTTTVPLAWKWQLGIARTGLAVGAMALIAGLIIASLGDMLPASVMLRTAAVWLVTMASATAVLAYRFYRDPDRRIPDRNDVIISPADGEIIYVREAPQGLLPVSTKLGRHYTLQELTKTPLQSADCVVIGIAMSFLDVHVNRAPIQGRITLQRHFPGIFGTLRLPEMLFQNERVTTVLENNELQIAVIQIASRLVRQIVSFVSENQEVQAGQRIGAIRFGSQVDLVLPARDEVRILVTPGQRVRAGESVLALFRPHVQTVTRPAGGQILDLSRENLSVADNP